MKKYRQTAPRLITKREREQREYLPKLIVCMLYYKNVCIKLKEVKNKYNNN